MDQFSKHQKIVFNESKYYPAVLPVNRWLSRKQQYANYGFHWNIFTISSKKKKTTEIKNSANEMNKTNGIRLGMMLSHLRQDLIP